ncbi:hypothetical protein NL676_024219 [Syzygium grande]|nr:hypothetical protein NL676_024219 [Syzygium grande]
MPTAPDLNFVGECMDEPPSMAAQPAQAMASDLIRSSFADEQRKTKRSSMADLRAIYGRPTVHGHPSCASSDL